MEGSWSPACCSHKFHVVQTLPPANTKTGSSFKLRGRALWHAAALIRMIPPAFSQVGQQGSKGKELACRRKLRPQQRKQHGRRTPLLLWPQQKQHSAGVQKQHGRRTPSAHALGTQIQTPCTLAASSMDMHYKEAFEFLSCLPFQDQLTGRTAAGSTAELGPSRSGLTVHMLLQQQPRRSGHQHHCQHPALPGRA